MQWTPPPLMLSVERLRELESGKARLKRLLVDAMLENEALDEDSRRHYLFQRPGESVES